MTRIVAQMAVITAVRVARATTLAGANLTLDAFKLFGLVDKDAPKITEVTIF